MILLGFTYNQSIINTGKPLVFINYFLNLMTLSTDPFMVNNPLLIDEFNRIDIIKGQGGKGQRLFPSINRRITIEHALKSCPENKWISVDNFLATNLTRDSDVL